MAKINASFRDPSGFVYREKGILFRQVNVLYKKHYDHLMKSGLYEKLVQTEMIVPHKEIHPSIQKQKESYKIIQPEEVPFISYPYEWSFSALKDAALTTLRIQKRALEYGMTLKDASAYNMQMFKGRMRLIDTLSFEIYQEGKPWVAYRQFCQHFLVPLSLMALKDVRLNQLLRIYIDGIPLDLASKLLPAIAKMNFGLLNHIYLHAQIQKEYSNKKIESFKKNERLSKFALMGLINSLEKTIRTLTWKPKSTEWGDYYSITNYSEKAFVAKQKIILAILRKINPDGVWDLGANNGLFSRLASDQKVFTVAFDIDPMAVNLCYSEVKAKKETHLLPLILDLTNPSSNIGWANHERMSLMERGPVSTVFALAIIHHLAISNNVPLEEIAKFFSEICQHLVIEFIPKNDSQTQKLLLNREDIFDGYTIEGFENAFSMFFRFTEGQRIEDSERIIYAMENKKLLKKKL
jgi:hypothetical protein